MTFLPQLAQMAHDYSPKNSFLGKMPMREEGIICLEMDNYTASEI